MQTIIGGGQAATGNGAGAVLVKDTDTKNFAKDVIEASADPIIVDRLTATGQVVNPGNPKQFADAIAAQRAGAADTARILGLKAAE